MTDLVIGSWKVIDQVLPATTIFVGMETVPGAFLSAAVKDTLDPLDAGDSNEQKSSSETYMHVAFIAAMLPGQTRSSMAYKRITVRSVD